MTNDQSATAPAIQALAKSGLTELPTNVSETYTRGVREQTINGQKYSSNEDPEFWTQQAEREKNRFIRAAQAFVDAAALRDYFAAGSNVEQLKMQISATQQQLSSMKPTAETDFHGRRLEEKLEAVVVNLSARLEAAQRDEKS